MIKFLALHPAEEQLLRFADGELRPKEAAAVRAHLEACWSCRAQLEDLERGVADYVRYHKGALKPSLPSPPQPWANLRVKMAQLDQRRPPAPSRMPSRWLSAAAVILLALLALYRFGRPPAVSAAELLHKAVVATPASAREHRQIRVRTHSRSFTRPASYRAAAAADTAPIQALFTAASFNWDDPLSARSYSAWRDQLPDKRDEVEPLGGRDANLYRIRTTTDHGALAEATLTLRVQDLAPVSETFQFRGSEWVEITEVATAPAVPSVVPPALAEVRPLESVPASAPLVQPSETEPAATQELQVIAALHQIGADLGEPIELTRNGRQLLVIGTGMEPERQKQVRSSLARLAGVAVRFEDPLPTSPEESTRPAMSVTASRAPLAAEMEKAIGGRVALEKFANQVLDLSETAMARAHALRNLAERFPASAESQLNERDRSLLTTLRQEHAQVLAGTAAEILDSLKPPLAALGARNGRSQFDASAWSNWQEGAERVFASAQETDQLLNQLLAGADSRLAPSQIPAQLASALGRFKARTAAYRDGLKEGTH